MRVISYKRPTTYGGLMNSLFNSELPAHSGFQNTSTMPKVNISQNDTEFVLAVAVPGLKKEDIKLKIEKNRLTISANPAAQAKPNDFKSIEFDYTSFERSFILPETIDSSLINAQYESGVLRICLPKTAEATPKVREVEIA